MPTGPRPRISKTALAELEGIFQYIERGSPQNAVEVIARLLDAIDALIELPPIRHKVVGRSRKHGSTVHALSVPPFIIYYRVDVREGQPEPTVLTVRHGRRRQPRRFD